MDRRFFLAGAAALAACGQSSTPAIETPGAHVKRMAITMDDFNLGFDIGLSPSDRNIAILDAFDAVGHKAAGFVTGEFVDTAFGLDVLKSWSDRGHLIENHTWSHPHAGKSKTSAYLTEIEQNQDYLKSLWHRPDYFRFPFLDDGGSREQQVELFQGLDRIGLRNAPVTLDTVDWYTTSRLEAALRADPKTDLAPYRDYYVTMCVTLSEYWDRVALALGYASLPHLVLMHHNILNGLFLKDVMQALKAEGWQFVNASVALAHTPYHALPPEPTNGRNWLTLKRREAGLDYRPYPEAYLRFGEAEMDRLGL